VATRIGRVLDEAVETRHRHYRELQPTQRMHKNQRVTSYDHSDSIMRPHEGSVIQGGTWDGDLNVEAGHIRPRNGSR
jgi:hypothetical protein